MFIYKGIIKNYCQNFAFLTRYLIRLNIIEVKIFEVDIRVSFKDYELFRSKKYSERFVKNNKKMSVLYF